MRLLSLHLQITIALTAAGLVSSNPTPTVSENRDCAYQKCIRPTNVPPRATSTISIFCESVLKTTPKPTTVTETAEEFVTITPPTATKTITETVTVHRSTTTIQAGPVARALNIIPREATTSAATTPALTSTANPSTIAQAPATSHRSAAVEEAELKIRDVEAKPTTYPAELVARCKTRSPPVSKFSPVCSCFLTRPTVTTTTTTTQTGTIKGTTSYVTKTVTVTEKR